MSEPVTLGDALAKPRGAPPKSAAKGRSFAIEALGLVVLTNLVLLPIWWLILRPENPAPMVVIGIGLLGLWVVLMWLGARRRTKRQASHFLLVGDQQGFMTDLRLDAKTAVIDGSNLYHFGLKEGLEARAVQLIARHLRQEGYRVVCFFDANIFYTLLKNRAFTEGPAHTTYLLTQVFGLEYSEIYVVPSGVQADKYILTTLKHLPTSFAVTNDRFRGYGKLYDDVMSGDQWRKGVVVNDNELRLLKYKFQTPIRLNER